MARLRPRHPCIIDRCRVWVLKPVLVSITDKPDEHLSSDETLFSSDEGNVGGMTDRLTGYARRLARKGWAFRFARTDQEKAEAVNLFLLVDGIAEDSTFDGDILVAESPHHRITGAILLVAWEERDGGRHCLVRTLAVAPGKRGRGIGTALLWAAREAACGAEVFGGCSPANEGFYRATGCEIRMSDSENGLVSCNSLYDRWFVLPRKGQVPHSHGPIGSSAF